jgi:hypothetical protein
MGYWEKQKMANNSEINKLIIQTVENNCPDKNVQELIKKALQYELDIWNRPVMKSTIKDEYEHIVEKVMKKVEKQ